MSDLIRRGDALKALLKVPCKIDSDNYAWIRLSDAFGTVDENVPSAEQERKTFHVIDKTTGKEADPYEIALNEDWAKSLCYCDMEGFAILEDGTLILTDECGRFEFIQENDRFEIVWDKVTDENANA